MEELTTSERIMWEILQEHRGRQQAITSRELAVKTGVDPREVRAIIAELRREGYPVASAVHPPYGFYIPETGEEAHECLAHLYSRIREIGETAKPLEKAFGRYLPGRQMVLDLFGGKGESA